MKQGIFTISGAVLCMDCYADTKLSEHAKTYNVADEYSNDNMHVVTICDACTEDIVIKDRDDVASQNNACIYINAELERLSIGECLLLQSGGMISVGYYNFDDGTNIIFNNDEYHNRFLVNHYTNNESDDYRIVGTCMSQEKIFDYILKYNEK